MIETALAVLLLLSSVLVHEAGHWMLLRRYGVPIKSLGLGLGPDLLRIGRFRVGMLPIGASITPDPNRYDSICPAKKMWVALAGPWLSAIYATALLVASLAVPPDRPEHTGLVLLSHLNWLLAGVNLLPVPPLDGFRALQHWLESRGTGLSTRTLGIAYRLGNGIVFGFGFATIGLLLTQR